MGAYIAQTCDIFLTMFLHIWICGHMETVPRHISGFQFWHFEKSTVFKNVEYLNWKCVFSPFKDSPHHPVVYVLPAGAFFSGKNTPLEFWSMYLVDFVDCLSILGSLPPPRGLCASRRGFCCLKKNTSLDFWTCNNVKLDVNSRKLT